MTSNILRPCRCPSPIPRLASSIYLSPKSVAREQKRIFILCSYSDLKFLCGKRKKENRQPKGGMGGRPVWWRRAGRARFLSFFTREDIWQPAQAPTTLRRWLRRRRSSAAGRSSRTPSSPCSRRRARAATAPPSRVRSPSSSRRWSGIVRRHAQRARAAPLRRRVAPVSSLGSTTSLAVDLEHFSRHAKRAGVSIEDVQLAARRNPQTKALIDAEARRLRLQRKSEKRGREAAG